jgi:acylphosphatase
MTLLRHVIVHGRVQGVGFRAWTETTALRLGLEGWVRNRRDGSVEALLAGTPDTVAAMLALIRRGPPGARVDRIEERDGSHGDLAARRAGERFSMLATV